MSGENEGISRAIERRKLGQRDHLVDDRNRREILNRDFWKGEKRGGKMRGVEEEERRITMLVGHGLLVAFKLASVAIVHAREDNELNVVVLGEELL